MNHLKSQHPGHEDLSFVAIILLFILPHGVAFSQNRPWKILEGTRGEHTAAIDIYWGEPDTVYQLGDSIIRSTDRGATWVTIQGQTWGTSYGNLKVDPTDSKILYISINSRASLEANAHWMSTDGGYNWRLLYTDGGLGISVIEIDPIAPGTVYIGWGPSQFARTTNRGQTWDTLLVPAQLPEGLAISPTNDSILYAGFQIGGVLKSVDKGKTWTQMPFVTPLQAGPSLVVDPRDPNIVYAGIPGTDTTKPNGIFKSTDGGITWQEKNSGVGKRHQEVITMRMNPKNPDDLFIGVGSTDSTGQMIFRSTNAGELWFNFSSGMPIGGGGVESIAIDTLNDRVYAGLITWPSDDGIYVLDSLSSTLSVESPGVQVPMRLSLAQNYPNPFNPQTTIRYELPRVTSVRLEVYNALGEKVATLVGDDRKAPGSYEILWNATKFSSGVYFYELKTDYAFQARKMILIK